MPLTAETWLDTFQVNTTTASSQFDPHIIQLANGNVLVTWTSNALTGVASTAGSDIVGQIYDAFGNTVGSEFRVNSGYNADDERDLQLAATTTGGWITTFVDDSGTEDDIRFEVFNSSGSRTDFGSVADDASGGLPNFRDPQVQVSSATSALFTWIEDNATGDDDVYMRFYNPSTEVMSAEQFMFTNSNGSISNLDMTVLSNGSYVVVAQMSNGTDDELRFEIVSSTGVQAGSTLVTSTNGNGDEDRNPTVVGLTGGSFVIAWENTDTSDTDLEFQIFNSSGTSTSGVITVRSGGATDNNNEPVLVALDDGGFMVFYDDDQSGSLAVRGQRYSSTGALVGSEFALDTTSNPSGIDAVTLGDGRVMVTWGNGEIYSQIIDTRDAASDGGYTPDDFDVGTIGNDTFTATSSHDAYGWDGNDDITDGGGLNNLYGGDGNDIIRAAGVDAGESMYGGNGTDTIVVTGNGNGTVFDLQAGTIVQGVSTQVAQGFEHATGSAADEEFNGNSSVNILTGNGGNDSFDGDGGSDTIYGGAGDDFMQLDSGDASDRFYGGADTDTVSFGGLGFNMEIITGATGTYAYSVGGSGVDMQDIENVIGGSGNDSMLGDSGSNVLTGNFGNDTLDGNGGNDTIYGGAGNDRIISHGAGEYYGDADNDLMFSGLGIEQMYGGTGTDTINHTAFNGTYVFDMDTGLTNYGGELFAEFENVVMGAGNDTVTGNASNNSITLGAGNDSADGENGNDVINGGTGTDTLMGSAGNDTLNGNNDNDVLYGGADNDVLTGHANADDLFGGTGTDSLYGGAGFDELYGGDGADYLNGGGNNDTIEGGNGNDTILGVNGSDSIDGGVGNDSISGGNGFDQIYGGTGADDINGGLGNDTMYGGGGHDTILGNAGSDILEGEGNNDYLNGQGGNDTIRGGSGNDELLGGGGNDWLNAGGGNDTLTGGAGADSFVFAGSAIGDNEIVDWRNNVDDIDLSGLIGINNFAQWQAASAQVGADVVTTLSAGNTITFTTALMGQFDAGDFTF